MAGEQLLPWIDSGDAEGNRNSMQNFEGDGIVTSFDFNFAGGYISTADVKAYIYHTASGLTTAIDPVVLTGPNTIQVIPAVPDGDFLVVYRDTPKDMPLVDYTTGAVLDEANLDKSNKQAIFVAAEMSDRFDAINASSADAIERSFEALTTANAAAADADAAVITANAANATAAIAQADAANALDIAQDAVAASTGLNVDLQLYTNNDVTARGLSWKTGSVAVPGNQRWYAGTDAASDFTLNRYDDAGALLGAALNVDRQTGLLTINARLTGLAAATAASDAIRKDQTLMLNGTQAMTADLTLANSTPTNALHAASRGYVLARAVGLSAVRGHVLSTTSGVTAYSMGATEAIIFRDVNFNVIVKTGAGITGRAGDIATAGPAAGGRDQAGAFANGSQIHLYYIYNPTTDTVSTLASLNATAPTLPSGYTHWALGSSVMMQVSAFYAMTAKGCLHYYTTTSPRVLSAGTSTSFAAVGAAGVVPSTASSILWQFILEAQYPAGGGVSVLARPTGSTKTGDFVLDSLAPTTGIILARDANCVEYPVINSASVDYALSAGGPSGGGVYIDVGGYRIRNGDV